ncbi:MAG: hypothetical protein KW804_02845 [Candidatus Doudnabacteria bacterium]|nr:hypothetical protein [Candidatus Doudnabacteria bacterium]
MANQSLGVTARLGIKRRILTEATVKRLIANYYSKSFRRFIKKIGAMASIMEFKHWGDHNLHVCCMTFGLAEAEGLPLPECDRYGFAALLHDFGKNDPVLAFLFEPGKLQYTREEEILSAKHAQAGVDLFNKLLAEIESVERIRERVPMLFDAMMIKLVHDCQIYHDRPFSRGGKKIPLIGRMCRIADAWDAMTARHVGRKYRKRRTPEEARRELLRCSGTDFDPDLVIKFLDQVLLSSGTIGSGRRGPKKKQKNKTPVLVSAHVKNYKTAPLPMC